MDKIDPLSFRCLHRHTAESHPQCYQRYLRGEHTNNLQVVRPRHQRSAKILLVDIETLPGEAYFFDPRVEYISPDKVIKDWSISCWAAKWLFDDVIVGERVSSDEAYARTDRSILGGIWKLMNEADIVVTQNGVNFDIKKLNSKFIENRFPPPAKYMNVDTLKVAKEVFGFTYNRLDELGQKLGIGKKIDMTFVDWKNCLTNNQPAEDALDYMLTYCKRDISPLLEDVYLAMLPYIKNHPNLNIFTNHDSDVCPKCESGNLKWNEKPYATPSGLWESFRCGACGATGRGHGKEHKLKSVTVS